MRKQLYPALGLVFGLALGPTACRRPAETDFPALAARAEDMHGRGLHLEAAGLLAPRLGALPPRERGVASFALARYYHAANAHQRALESARQAAELGVEDPNVLYIAGDCERHLRAGGAAATLERLLGRHPDHKLARLALARLRTGEGDWERALPLFEGYFRAATSGEAEYRTALLEHGRALRLAGRYQEAADRFAAILEDDPYESAPHADLAAALYRLGRRGPARLVEDIYRRLTQNAFDDHVEEGLRESGATAFALGQRAVIRTRERRFLDAFRSYRQALELDRADPRLRILHASLCSRFHRTRDAGEAVDAALGGGIRPASGLWFAKGQIAVDEGRPAEALGAFRAGIVAHDGEGVEGSEAEGRASPFALRLGVTRAALEAGEPALAEEAVAAAAALRPQAWEVSFWRGRLELARGDSGAAAASFEESGRRGGGAWHELALWHALALAKAGRREDARRRLEGLRGANTGFLRSDPELARLAGGESPGGDSAGKVLAERARVGPEIEAARRRAGSLPLEASGEAYLELGRLHRALGDATAFDFYFLAADLLPERADVYPPILDGLRQPHDVFIRLHYLRRLERLRPDNDTVILALLEIHTQLQARLEEARSLADRLAGPGRTSAASFRLRGTVALLLGKREEAREIFTAGIAAFPSDTALREAMARLEAPADDSAGPPR